jgi:lipoate-protein ligase A
MTDAWRFFGIDCYDAYMNMAIDESISRTKLESDTLNTVRFYRWQPSAVSIGYFQIAEEEVDFKACSDLNIDIVRRITGGGAVYHDYAGELTYSLIVDESDKKIPKDITKSYEVICLGIVEGLKTLDIDATFKPINDITVNGRKISGNAQTRRWGIVLQHGTILVDADIRTMFKALKVSKEKISDKQIKAVEDRVTTINKELGRKVTFEEIASALKKGFKKTLDINLTDQSLTDRETSLALELRKTKFKNKDWNMKRPSQFRL